MVNAVCILQKHSADYTHVLTLEILWRARWICFFIYLVTDFSLGISYKSMKKVRSPVDNLTVKNNVMNDFRILRTSCSPTYSNEFVFKFRSWSYSCWLGIVFSIRVLRPNLESDIPTITSQVSAPSLKLIKDALLDFPALVGRTDGLTTNIFVGVYVSTISTYNWIYSLSNKSFPLKRQHKHEQLNTACCLFFLKLRKSLRNEVKGLAWFFPWIMGMTGFQNQATFRSL